MEKIDLAKERKELFTAKTEPAFMESGNNLYLIVDGKGDPSTSQEFKDAIGALYGAAYKIKFAAKERDKDFKVLALEGLWHYKILSMPKSEWEWTLQVLMPSFVTQEDLRAAREELEKKKPNPFNALVCLEKYEDGTCVQILHLGPYSDEPRTIARMDAFIAANGYRKAKEYHREVYISDPLRTAPEKLKTIIRQPVEKEGI